MANAIRSVGGVVVTKVIVIGAAVGVAAGVAAGYCALRGAQFGRAADEEMYQKEDHQELRDAIPNLGYAYATEFGREVVYA